ncbi:uncharacterized protein LOC121051332 [Rosa chinensis]|uniref:uncharacterized protein LOC121051332 n=1 Tax=Rosa chinensis TaxID=74649 RepID=UPI001AD8CCBB|nr:uncharacterized protein LOC121051332 [Rosa chinensis]
MKIPSALLGLGERRSWPLCTLLLRQWSKSPTPFSASLPLRTVETVHVYQSPQACFPATTFWSQTLSDRGWCGEEAAVLPCWVGTTPDVNRLRPSRARLKMGLLVRSGPVVVRCTVDRYVIMITGDGRMTDRWPASETGFGVCSAIDLISGGWFWGRRSSAFRGQLHKTDGAVGNVLSLANMGVLRRGLAAQRLGSRTRQVWVPRGILGAQLWTWALSCLGYSRWACARFGWTSVQLDCSSRTLGWAFLLGALQLVNEPEAVRTHIWDPGDCCWALNLSACWNCFFDHLGRRLLSIQRILLRGVGKVGHTTGGHLDRRLPSILRISLRGSMVDHTIGTVLHRSDSVWCLIKCLIASLRIFAIRQSLPQRSGKGTAGRMRKEAGMLRALAVGVLRAGWQRRGLWGTLGEELQCAASRKQPRRGAQRVAAQEGRL